MSAALRSLASAMAVTVYDAVTRAESPNELDVAARLLWDAWGNGAISAEDASYLDRYLAARRPATRRPASQATLPGMILPPENPKPVSRFSKRRPQRSPDRQKSCDRRHRLAFSGVMPPHLAARLTVSDMAVLRVVADEYRAHAACELSLDAIAARAGVHHKTAKRAMSKAQEQKLISVEVRPVPHRKNRTNLIKVISFEWLKWLRPASRAELTVQHEAATKLRHSGTTRDSEKPASLAEAMEGRAAALPGGHLRPPTDTSLEDDSAGAGDQTAAQGRAESPERGQPSKEAVEFAVDLASIAGHRRAALPGSWIAADPARLVQAWINALAPTGLPPVKVLHDLTSAVMRRKPDRLPPHSPRYFSREIAMLIGSAARQRLCRPSVAA